jgi:tRNA(Ile2) C34 agmatinyltransferase TiaS
MLIYIAIILTIHTLIGLYSVVTSRIEQHRHRRLILNEIEERNKFFDELENKLIESGEVKEKEDCPLKLEKQVPQKVKKYKGLNETACPNCRFVFGDYEYDDEKFDYCYNCGQRLNWESEVEHDA